MRGEPPRSPWSVGYAAAEGGSGCGAATRPGAASRDPDSSRLHRLRSHHGDGYPAANRILDLGNAVGPRHQVEELRCATPHLRPILDPSRGLAFRRELAAHLDLHGLDRKPALVGLAEDVVAVAGDQSQEEELTAIDARAPPRFLGREAQGSLDFAGDTTT